MAKIEITPEAQAVFTNKLLKEFAEGLDESLKNRLREIRPKVPHETIKNLRYQIMEANASDISAKYELYFQDSGRLSEMKRLKGGKMLNVDSILEWIKRGRQNDFNKVPSYSESFSRLSRAKQLERIAWAIAISKSKGTFRRGAKLQERLWLRRYFYGWYRRMIRKFIREQSTFLKELVKLGFGQDLGNG